MILELVCLCVLLGFLGATIAGDKLRERREINQILADFRKYKVERERHLIERQEGEVLRSSEMRTNQCMGCQAGWPLGEDGLHRYRPMIGNDETVVCTRDRYPADRSA